MEKPITSSKTMVENLRLPPLICEEEPQGSEACNDADQAEYSERAQAWKEDPGSPPALIPDDPPLSRPTSATSSDRGYGKSTGRA